MMIPQETIAKVLDTARIDEVVGDFVSLKRRGSNLIACCPFHNEKTPSFSVSPAKGIYKCFGCGKSGSAVGFVMEHEGLTYPEAIKYLAKKYGIEVVEKEESAEEIAAKQRTESLYIASEWAQQFFARQLESGEGRSIGLAYFHSRGLEDETIKKFGLGWAPSGKTTLLDAARAAGYKDEYLIGAGLVVQREDGTLADKFRERVMFPIHSVSGRVVAYSGRTLHSENRAKYVNSAETEIYIKSRHLLGIYFAKSDIVRLKKCILVEGNVDMVTMHQLGIRNVVASCGTSLTVEQIRLIHKFTENMTIMYDGDKAGIKAALRGINLVLEEGMNVSIVLLPDGEDPDSFGRKHSLEEVNDYISQNERDFIEFKTELLLTEAGSNPLKKSELIIDIAETISKIPDAIKREVYVQTVSRQFEVKEETLLDRVASSRKKAVEERKKALYRESQAGSATTPAEVAEVPAENSETFNTVQPKPFEGFENPKMVAAEKDILWYLVKYGSEELHFQKDSDFYTGDEVVTVAEFISSAIEGDGLVFANHRHRKAYEAYMDAFFAEDPQTQEKIVLDLLNSEDRDLADTVAEFIDDKYILSIKNLKNSMTRMETMLTIGVPKAAMVFKLKKIESDIMEKTAALRHEASEEVQRETLAELGRLNKIKLLIKEKLGREKQK